MDDGETERGMEDGKMEIVWEDIKINKDTKR